MVQICFYGYKGEYLKIYIVIDIWLVGLGGYYWVYQIKMENVQMGNIIKVQYSGFVIDVGVDVAMFFMIWMEIC